MSEKLREAVSAAVDGEASEFELRRVFDEMGKDESLLRAWQSYHLIGQAVRGENVDSVADVGERIWASLDAEEFLEQDIVQEEPISASSPHTPKRRWGLAGGALAAALSLGVILSGGFLDTDSDAEPAIAANQVVENIPAPVSSGVPSSVRDADLGDGQRLLDPNSVQVASNSEQDDYDYGPGFVPYSELSAAEQARSDGYFLHHVQNQAVNDDNVLRFVKMISLPE